MRLSFNLSTALGLALAAGPVCADTIPFPIPPLITAEANRPGSALRDEFPPRAPDGLFTPYSTYGISFEGTVTRSIGDPDPLGATIALNVDLPLNAASFTLGSYSAELNPSAFILSTEVTRDLVDPLIRFDLELPGFPLVYASSIPAPPGSGSSGEGFRRVNATLWVEVDGMLPYQEAFYPCADYPDYLFCDVVLPYASGGFDIASIGFAITSFDGQEDVAYDNPLTPWYDPGRFDLDLPGLGPGLSGPALDALRAEIIGFSASLQGPNVYQPGPPVAAVPLPGGLPLLGLGLAGLAALRRRA